MKFKTSLLSLFLLGIFSYTHYAYSWWFSVVDAQRFAMQNKGVVYHECHPVQSFNYQALSCSLGDFLQPTHGELEKTAVLEIPYATAASRYGFVIHNGQYIDEMMWKRYAFYLDMISYNSFQRPAFIPSSVVVLGQMCSHMYFHWLTEVLSRLAMIEMMQIPYEYVYAPYDAKFMKETFELWGIDSSKILNPDTQYPSIKAQNLIVPTIVCTPRMESKDFCNYIRKDLLDYVRNKLANAVKDHNCSVPMHPKIFVSRKDAGNRQIVNEDEIFAMFKPFGFVRYELGRLSVADQIKLFEQAEIIVGPHGGGFTNILFSKPGTSLIEIFQEHCDCCFGYMAQQYQIEYD
ncbi:glycosyltransferase family 61 protein, partial [Candidatus Babeliales bacterium]|nr:glycosyltransferase family 61 protein [Candidatus Babeliales bacterium]